MDSNVENRPPSLNVFQGRGIAPDVHLVVFGSYLHVHSIVLKMHSQFFYSFLDAPGSAAPIVRTNFKYSWITKVLDDGKGWQLVSKNDKVYYLWPPVRSKIAMCWQGKALQHCFPGLCCGS